MKNKILVSLILTAMIAQGSAFAEGEQFASISDKLDRSFDIDRTLYYVTIDDDVIPDIEEAGFTVIKKATSYQEGTPKASSVTLLQDDATGVYYRFVFKKAPKGSVTITSIKYTSEGVLEVDGELQSDVKVFILKPTEEKSKEFIKWEDVNQEDLASGILTAFELKESDITDSQLIRYTLPNKAISGAYGIMIVGEGVSYVSDPIFCVSLTDIKNAVDSLNQITTQENNQTNQDALLQFLTDNAIYLNVDLSYYDKLSASGKLKAVSYLFKTDAYQTQLEVERAIKDAIILAYANDGQSTDEILADYGDGFGFNLYEEYKALSKKSLPQANIRGILNKEEFIKAFDNAVAIQMINEAEPGEVTDIITGYNDYLSLDSTHYDSYVKNASICARKLCDCDFETTKAIEDKIDEAIKNSNNGSKTKGGGGGSSGGSSKNYADATGDLTSPSTDTQIEPDSDKKDAESGLPFTDMKDFDWAEKAVKYMYNHAILSGKSEKQFAPSDNITREEFAKIIVTAFEFSDKKAIEFEDVKGHWSEEYIQIAACAGVVSGISDTEFGIGQNITREDMAVMLKRAIDKAKTTLDIVVEDIPEISDMDDVSEYAKSAVEFLLSKGAVKGSDGRFNPKSYATRAEAAQMVYNVIKVR